PSIVERIGRWLARDVVRGPGVQDIQVRSDIQVHPDPPQERSVTRPKRLGATQKPGVASISATNSKTHLSGFARAQTSRPDFTRFLLVVGMQKWNMGVPCCADIDIKTQRMIKWKANVVCGSPVHEGEPAGWSRVPGVNRNRVQCGEQLPRFPATLWTQT